MKNYYFDRFNAIVTEETLSAFKEFTRTKCKKLCTDCPINGICDKVGCFASAYKKGLVSDETEFEEIAK